MKTEKVTYKGVKLEVYYDIEEGDPGDHITGPTADKYEIFGVQIGLEDILPLLSWEQEDDLKSLLIFANN